MIRHLFLHLAFAFVVLGAAASPSSAQEWTRFRGPNGQGGSDAETIPTQWTSKDFNWRIELPGAGHGSPVVWGDRVFLQSADPEKATHHIVCISTTGGKTLWNQSFASNPHHLHAFNSFASSTPALDEDRVYVTWATPRRVMLTALSHDGVHVWQRDLGPFVSMHGFGMSPIVHNGAVILANHQQGETEDGSDPGVSFVIAVDCKTGETKWKTPRVSTRANYPTPFVYQPEDGPAELIFATTRYGIDSLDPKSGKQNWRVPVIDKRTVGSPIHAGGLIFATTGSGGGGNYISAIRPGKDAEEVYRIDQAASYVPTLVAHGDLVFFCYDKGIATCVDAPTGRTHWRQRLGGSFFSSPIRVRNRIYCTELSGEVIVLAASKDFELLARNPLGELTRATPAVSGGRIYFRTLSHLISLGGE
jgi:outer membrane protein assembly factor BamB